MSTIDMKDEALDKALEALEKISRTQYHIETPPIESLEEQMRRIADKAITACEQALAAPVQEPVKHLMVAYELAQKELARLVKENFGQMPRNDKWADSVLDLRNKLESQKTESKK
jgi:hypothetical protein